MRRMIAKPLYILWYIKGLRTDGGWLAGTYLQVVKLIDRQLCRIHAKPAISVLIQRFQIFLIFLLQISLHTF